MRKNILALFCIAVAIVYGIHLMIICFDEVLILDSKQYFFFFGCILSMTVLWKFKNQLGFFTTFEHELTHNIWALLFFKKPIGFHVNAAGTGYFHYTGKPNNITDILIALAPYFFPTACFLWLPFYFMCKPDLLTYYYLLMGFFMGYHILSTKHETHHKQTDILQNGIIYSYIIIVSLNIFFTGIIIAHLNGGISGLLSFIKNGPAFIINLFK